MVRKKTLAEELADLATTAPSSEFDPEQDSLGLGPALLETDNELEEEPDGIKSRKAAEKGLRLRAGIDLESEDYAGKRVSRAAAFGDPDTESGEDEEADGNQSEDQDLPNGLDERPGSSGQEDGGDEDSSSPEEERVAEQPNSLAASGNGHLEQAYADVQASDAIAMSNLKDSLAKERAKGIAAKHQQGIWDRLLEVRILLQKSLAGSQRLPRPDVYPAVRDAAGSLAEGYDQLTQACSSMADALLDLQAAMLQQNPAILREAGEGKRPRAAEDAQDEGSAKWQRLDGAYAEIGPFRDASLDRWHRKTLLSSGGTALKGNLRMLNQSLSTQVHNMMRNPDRLLARTQLPASLAPQPLCAPAAGVSLPTSDGGNGSAEETDPETYDDSEFYQQLLKEFLEASNATDMLGTRTSTRGNKSRAMRDRRASKGRRLRYDVQEKLVNFMAPQPQEAPAMASQLFRNLFGHTPADTQA